MDCWSMAGPGMTGSFVDDANGIDIDRRNLHLEPAISPKDHSGLLDRFQFNGDIRTETPKIDRQPNTLFFRVSADALHTVCINFIA